MSEAILAPWQATSAWAIPHRRVGSRQGEAGVRLRLLEHAALTTLIARQGRHDALAALVREHFGCDLPAAGKASFGLRGDIVWSARTYATFTTR